MLQDGVVIDVDAAILDLVQHLTLRQIAIVTRCSMMTISRRMRALGRARGRGGRQDYVLTPDDWLRAREARERGESFGSIAAQYGVSRQAIQQGLRRRSAPTSNTS